MTRSRSLALTAIALTGCGGKIASILLKNAVIQVKSGSGTGLTSQLARTQAVTDLPVIGYGPQLGGAVFRGVQAAGRLVTRDLQLLIDVVTP